MLCVIVWYGLFSLMTNHFYTSLIENTILIAHNNTLCLFDIYRYDIMGKNNNRNPYISEKCYYKNGCYDCKNDCKIQGYRSYCCQILQCCCFRSDITVECSKSGVVNVNYCRNRLKF